MNDEKKEKEEEKTSLRKIDEQLKAEEEAKAAEEKERPIKERSAKAAIDKSLSRKDAVWILPIVAIFGLTGYWWGLLGIVIVVVFITLLLVAIYFMAGEQIWFMSVPQNAAIGIMWGSGEKRRLHRLAIVIGNDIFALDAAGNRMKVYWFEKVFNIWWMSPWGSVHKYHTLEFLRVMDTPLPAGKHADEEMKVIVKEKDFIEIGKEIVLPLQIPPLPCKENFDVTPAASAFYIIHTALDALKALFNVGNLSLALTKKFGAALKVSAGNKSFDELRAEQEGINSEAWKKMKEGGDFDRIHKDWGVQVNDIVLTDITAEPDAAAALKSVAIADMNAKAKIKEGEGIGGFKKAVADGDKYAREQEYAGLAAGYEKVAKIADGAGIELEKLRTLQIMPSAKIISMPDFTGALSDATGKNPRTLAADLIAAGFTLEQFRDEFVKAKQAEEAKKHMSKEETPGKPESIVKP